MQKRSRHNQWRGMAKLLASQVDAAMTEYHANIELGNGSDVGYIDEPVTRLVLFERESEDELWQLADLVAYRGHSYYSLQALRDIKYLIDSAANRLAR